MANIKEALQKGTSQVASAGMAAGFNKGKLKCDLRAKLAEGFAKNGMNYDMIQNQNVKSAA